MIRVAIHKEIKGEQAAVPDMVAVDGMVCKIGQDKTNDIVLDGPGVSRRHAQIMAEDDGFVICDLRSRMGTFMRGYRLPALRKIKLRPDAAITIGRHVLKLETDNDGVENQYGRISDRADPVQKDAAGEEKENRADRTTRHTDYFKDPEIIKLKAKLHQKLLSLIELRRLDFNKATDRDLRSKCKDIVQKIISEESYDILNQTHKREIIKDILDEALGLGPLEDLIADEAVTEIMVNRPDLIYIEKNGKIIKSSKIFSNAKSVNRIISRIVGPLGRRIDESSPMVDARLADGSRVNVIIPPLALDGPCLTIRKFSKNPLTVEDMIGYRSVSREMVDFIKNCVFYRKNVLIAGGTGSGKTTCLNVFSSFIPADERVVTIEDAAELQLPQEHVIRLESRPPNIEGEGEITIRQLVKNALRMRPDRIIIGECRGGETLDMLQAMNTGHDGSITTIHANSPKDVISRLETMVLQAGTDLSSRAIREQIASALDIVIQQVRFSCGTRKITNIAEVVGMDDGKLILQDIFYFKQEGIDAAGKIVGSFLATGWIPEYYEALQKNGIDLDMTIFHN